MALIETLVGIVVVALLPTMLFGVVALRKWRLRNDVWVAIDTKAGNRTVLTHGKPKKDNTVDTRWGPYLTTEDGFTRTNPGLFSPKDVPLYRYVEGVRTPIKLADIISENPGLDIIARNLDRALRDTKTLERNNWIRMMFGKSEIIVLIVVSVVSGLMGALIVLGLKR